MHMHVRRRWQLQAVEFFQRHDDRLRLAVEFCCEDGDGDAAEQRFSELSYRILLLYHEAVFEPEEMLSTGSDIADLHAILTSA